MRGVRTYPDKTEKEIEDTKQTVSSIDLRIRAALAALTTRVGALELSVESLNSRLAAVEAIVNGN